jgi:hypothetical protein
MYETYISNRTFALGPAHTPQILPAVFFNDFATSYAYDNWANNFIPTPPGQPAEDPDGDTFPNYQEFLFGTSPVERTNALHETHHTAHGLVLRWLERTSGASYRLEETTDPAIHPWPASSAAVTDDPDQSNVPENYVRKTTTIPFGMPHNFIRIAGRE